MSSRRAAPVRRVELRVPEDFVLHRAVMGHGWFDLPPFHWDHEAGRLTRPLSLPGSGPVPAHITQPAARGGALRIDLEADRAMSRADLASARRQVAHILRVDEDLSAFHETAARIGRPDLGWVRSRGAGRLLRAPGVFEDLVKMIATTNCTWALTRVMINGLVQHLGEPAGAGRQFPTPEAMAGARPAFYRDVARAGYRGEALAKLARDVASGRLDPGSWLDPARPTPEIRQEILSVRGAGPYVADNMLKLLGRYDGLGIDSWCRRKFSRLHAAGRRVTDRRIERFYAPFGRWRGLALWCDITRDWFEEGSPREKFALVDY